jgi:nicotinamidase-related amidase
MNESQSAQSLLNAHDSLLIAIDIQDAFLNKLPKVDSEKLVNRACWLIAVAGWLKIPVIVTVEELNEQPLAPKLVQSLPAGTRVFNKLVFGLAHQPDILAAVEATGRKTAVLIGLETDVCVAQSALGLMEQGYRVAVVADVVGSPQNGQEIGLNRMREAGTMVVSLKSLFYEWMRTVEQVTRFHQECPGMREPDGIVL